MSNQKTVKLLDSATIEESVKHLLTFRQVAKMFNVSEMTLYIWKRYRGLPTIQIPGDGRAAVRFHPVDLQKWARREGIAVPTARSRAYFRKTAPAERKRLAAA